MGRLRTLAGRARGRSRQWWHDRWLRRLGLTGLVYRTQNFGKVSWLGHPIWQNPLDAWNIQETIVENEVDLVIECGTNQGGSAYYMATLFDLLDRGHVITVDIEPVHGLEHPRIDFITASSVEPETLATVKKRVDELQPNRTMVLLDSDHTGPHVLRELELYSDLVPIGGYMLTQDGCIDELRLMRADRPGPLWAIRRFVEQDQRFEIDVERSRRYLFSHSPSGWLRRTS